MKTKQEIIDHIQHQYDIGDNQEQEFYAWASDEILKHTPLTFRNMIRKEMEEQHTSTIEYYCSSSLINFIEGN